MSEIPNGETLFKYVYPDALPKDQDDIPVSLFNVTELSVDWERYREDPMTSFHVEEGKSIVIAITVSDDIKNPKNPKRKGEIVEAWKQEVIHDPVTAEQDPAHGENLAHSLIRGKKKGAVVDAIKDNARILNE